MTKLHEVAFARAGDKGNTSILMLAPYDPASFDVLHRALSARAVADHFGVPVSGVTVLASPALAAFTIVIRGLLDGGVTRSGRIDPHGKTLSAHLLDLDVPD